MCLSLNSHDLGRLYQDQAAVVDALLEFGHVELDVEGESPKIKVQVTHVPKLMCVLIAKGSRKTTSSA